MSSNIPTLSEAATKSISAVNHYMKVLTGNISYCNKSGNSSVWFKEVNWLKNEINQQLKEFYRRKNRKTPKTSLKGVKRFRVYFDIELDAFAQNAYNKEELSNSLLLIESRLFSRFCDITNNRVEGINGETKILNVVMTAVNQMKYKIDYQLLGWDTLVDPKNKRLK